MTLKREKSYKDYLDKTFLEELNYKIWSTKGSRFNANKRLLLISRLSNLSNSMLSVYLIAIGLLSVYNIYNNGFIAQSVLPYITTCLSILLLVFSQIENSKNYQLKAKEFHNCGLELSKLYNKLRVFKTMDSSTNDKNKELFTQEIATQYELILEKYDNHEPIDHSLFKTRNAKYFEISWIEVFCIKTNYYIKTQLGYHLIILIPPVILISILTKILIK